MGGCGVRVRLTEASVMKKSTKKTSQQEPPTHRALQTPLHRLQGIIKESEPPVAWQRLLALESVNDCLFHVLGEVGVRGFGGGVIDWFHLLQYLSLLLAGLTAAQQLAVWRREGRPNKRNHL